MLPASPHPFAFSVMRKLDVLTIGLIILLAGGGAYGVFQVVGWDTEQAGIWASALLALLLLGWTFSYLKRFWTGTMSINQQGEMYKTEVFKQQLEAMSPEELAEFQAEVGIESTEAPTPEVSSSAKASDDAEVTG
ncbi:MAG: DUF3007 family protein [Cyanobacteria bacterium P01_A01_bin.3]